MTFLLHNLLEKSCAVYLDNCKILPFRDFIKSCILYTDASSYSLGAVLAQIHGGKERAIKYTRWNLTPPVINYCVSELDFWRLCSCGIIKFVQLFSKQKCTNENDVDLFLERCEIFSTSWSMKANGDSLRHPTRNLGVILWLSLQWRWLLDWLNVFVNPPKISGKECTMVSQNGVKAA